MLHKQRKRASFCWKHMWWWLRSTPSRLWRSHTKPSLIRQHILASQSAPFAATVREAHRLGTTLYTSWHPNSLHCIQATDNNLASSIHDLFPIHSEAGLGSRVCLLVPSPKCHQRSPAWAMWVFRWTNITQKYWVSRLSVVLLLTLYLFVAEITSWYN